MPFKPLMMAGTESLPDISPYRPPVLKTVRSHLLDKVLRVEIKGSSTSPILVFNRRQIDVLGKWAGNVDYIVIACASVLPKLRNHQQLTTLIRSDELEVQGDIQAMQNLVALADLVKPGPAELLAPYTNDITVGGISRAMRGGAKFLHHGIKRQQHYVAEATTGEWRMAPDPLEVVRFVEGAAAVECAVDALTRRSGKLEAK